MPCTPTAGLSHSYISQWANLTMLQQSSSLDTVPSLDPIPSPARGRVRVRKTRDEQSSADEEAHTPRGWTASSRRSAHSPHPQLAPVSSRGSLANYAAMGRTRTARLQVRHPAAPVPNPTLSFRRFAQKPVETMNRTASDLTSRLVQRERTATTPSPDLIFNMSPVLGLEGPSRPYRVASRLSGEPDVAGDGEFDVPVDRVEELHVSESKRDPSFLYSYALHAPEPSLPSIPPCDTSTSHATSDFDGSSLASVSGLVVLDELDAGLDPNPCVIEPPAMPRLGRMHAKSDPLPTRLASTSSGSILASSRHSVRTQPIPIPKPAPRVPSDYGGVNASLAPSAPPTSSMLRWAKAPAPAARMERRLRQEAESTPAEDVTGEWCGTADVIPVCTGVAATRRRRDAPARKKRFFIGVGESYDGDMDSELSSWHA